MPTFDAGADPITYNFTKYQPGVQGEIPEPTTRQIEVFAEMLKTVMPSKEVPVDDADPDGPKKTVIDVDALAALAEDTDLQMLVANALSDVCSNTPTAEQILALPYRVQQKFAGWIAGTFLSPEA